MSDPKMTKIERERDGGTSERMGIKSNENCKKIQAHLELYSLQQSLKKLVPREKEGTAAHEGR